MEHVVFFPAQDGAPAFRRVPTLEEAVRLVEHLRNVEGVSQVSCHALTEVPLAFKTYYRVEVPADEAPTTAPAEPVAAFAPAVESAPVLAVPVLVAPDVAPDLSLVLEAPAVVDAPLEAVAVPEQPVAETAPEPVAPAATSSLGFFSR